MPAQRLDRLAPIVLHDVISRSHRTKEPAAVTRTAGPQARPRVTSQLYFWVLVGIIAGTVTGSLSPRFGVALEPLGSTFVSLIKMVIAPVIFCTVVTGLASMDSLKQVGRVGGKALLYFEGLTTVALLLGLAVANVVKPGRGIDVDPDAIPVDEGLGGLIEQGESSSWYDFLLRMVPDSIVGAFADGDVLQVLFVSVLFALALRELGARGQAVARAVETFGQVMFGIVRLVMYAAPVGAFGAMAFAVGTYGLSTLTGLLALISTFYATSLFFVVVVLGLVLKRCGVSIFALLRYLRPELLVVLGTSSSETVLPQLMRKLVHLGCPKPVVGLTVPSGYSFNLNGTCIYLSMASLFIAQAQDISLSFGQQVTLVLVLMLTSKGATGVTGSGFIVLASTLSALSLIPVAGVVLIFGIDRLMSKCRALTNLCGNATGSIVVATWEKSFDQERCRRVLSGESLQDLDEVLEDDTLVTERIDPAVLAQMSRTPDGRGLASLDRLDQQPRTDRQDPAHTSPT